MTDKFKKFIIGYYDFLQLDKKLLSLTLTNNKLCL